MSSLDDDNSIDVVVVLENISVDIPRLSVVGTMSAIVEKTGTFLEIFDVSFIDILEMSKFLEDSVTEYSG